MSLARRYAPLARTGFRLGRALWKRWVRPRGGGRNVQAPTRRRPFLPVKGVNRNTIVRSSRRGTKRPTKSLSQKVNSLSKRIKNSTAIYRVFTRGGTIGVVNKYAHHQFVAWSLSTFNAAMAKIPAVFEVAGADTLSDIDRTATSTKANFKAGCTCFADLELRNNDDIDHTYEIYTMECKQNTDSAPATLMTSLYANSYFGPAGATDLTVFPSEIQGLSAYWKVLKCDKLLLNPGESTHVKTSQKLTVSAKDFTSALAYVANKSRVILVRAHGNVGTQVADFGACGYPAAKISGIIRTSLKLTFDGDGTHTISTAETLSAPDLLINVQSPTDGV